MSNPFGWLTPPGCSPNDTGPMGEDDYKCEVCGRTCTQGELDSDADDPVCRECAALGEEVVEALAMHTPGPWQVSCAGLTPRGDRIVYLMSEHRLGDAIADARLIAAAPALVEALERLLLATGNAVVRLDFNGSKEGELATLAILRKAMEPARAALALARRGAK